MTSSAQGAKRLIKHSTIYAIGNISRQLVGFVMLPVYTHFLTPADYGVVSLLTFALALMEPLFGARLGEAMLRFYYEQNDPEARNRVISTCFVVSGVVSTVVSALVVVFRDGASQLLFGSLAFTSYVALFGCMFLTQALEYYGLTFVRIQQKPVLFITFSLTKLVLQLGLNIWLVVYERLGVMGIVISGIVSSSIYALILSVYTMVHTGWKCDLPIARRMFIFSWPLWLSGLASLYIYSSNRYYIRIFSSLDEVGLYELAAKFAMILGLVIWYPFSQFWETERYRHFKSERARSIFGSVFDFISALLVLAATGISIFAEPTIQLMSEAQFHPASVLVPVLAIGGIFGFLTSFANFSFIVTDHTRQISINNYITVVVVTVLNVTLVRAFGAMGAAAALGLALLVQLALARWTAARFYDMGIRLAPMLGMTAVGIGAYLLANKAIHFENLLIDLVAKAGIYLLFAIVVIGMLLRNSENRSYLLATLEPITARLRRNYAGDSP